MLSEGVGGNYLRLGIGGESLPWPATGLAKDQAPCGSCYIFAAMGVLECQWGRRFNTSVDLSEQRVVDCGHLSGLDMDGMCSVHQ